MKWRFYADGGLRSKVVSLKEVKTLLTDEQIAEANEAKRRDPEAWVRYRVPSGFLKLEED